MSSSAKQQASRREELRLTAQERLDTDTANRILFLLTQIDDSMDEIGRLFPDYARKTIITFTEITGTNGLTARLGHDLDYGNASRFMYTLDQLAREGTWR